MPDRLPAHAPTARTHRVLLVEDHPPDALLCREALIEGGAEIRIDHVGTLAAALDALDVPYDAVLMDLHLPDGNGDDALVQIVARAPDTPVIVLTGHIERELGARLVTAGAEDFLLKDEIGSGRLERVVSHAVARRALRPLLGEAPTAVLELLHGDGGGRRFPVRSHGTTLGRSPSNAVCLEARRVSRHHAMIWLDKRALWIEDLGSSNGTCVNGVRIHGPHRLVFGDRLTLGDVAHLAVRAPRPSDPRPSPFRPQILRPEDSTDPDFSSLLEVDTTLHDGGPLPYAVDVTLAGEDGCRAVVSGPQIQVTLDAGMRVSLMWALAEKHQRDRAAGVPLEQAGWLDDSELCVSVWGGRAARRQNRSRLSVLLHRVRKDLEEGGLDGQIIEKRRHATRLAVTRATAR